MVGTPAFVLAVSPFVTCCGVTVSAPFHQSSETPRTPGGERAFNRRAAAASRSITKPTPSTCFMRPAGLGFALPKPKNRSTRTGPVMAPPVSLRHHQPARGVLDSSRWCVENPDSFFPLNPATNQTSGTRHSLQDRQIQFHGFHCYSGSSFHEIIHSIFLDQFLRWASPLVNDFQLVVGCEHPPELVRPSGFMTQAGPGLAPAAAQRPAVFDPRQFQPAQGGLRLSWLSVAGALLIQGRRVAL